MTKKNEYLYASLRSPLGLKMDILSLALVTDLAAVGSQSVAFITPEEGSGFPPMGIARWRGHFRTSL